MSPRRSRPAFLVPVLALALGLPGCKRDAPAPQPEATATRAPVPAPEPVSPAAPASPAASASASPSASPAAARPKLDVAALGDRQDPARVLRFYAAALEARQWAAAARAWAPGMGVTAATLRAAYDRPEAPRLEIGKGMIEGAAGSLFYEAPVELRFGAGAPPERGTLVLRRVNDVDGATAAQRRWHIERSTIGAGQ
jgi:hypothetical protein